MNTKFENAMMLMPDKGHSFKVVRGTLVTFKDRIVFAGSDEEFSQYENDLKEDALKIDETIDCRNNLLMPGFKNAHTHTAMTFLRSYADDLPLQDWLTKQVFPKEALLREDDIYWLDLLGIMEYLTSGITANFDMYFYPRTIARASIDAGFRTVQTSSFNNFGGSPESMEEDYNFINDMGSDLVSFIIGFHAEYTTSMDKMERVASLADKLKSPVYLHNSETRREVDECLERWGKTPTELMDSLGMYKYGGGSFHAIWLNDNDYKIMKERGLYAVTNPCSNAKLASGICDLKRIIDDGIGLAIGTDGPASNNALDFFREIYMAAVLQKLKYMDAAAVPADEILYAAVSGGAHAMGLFDCDSLYPGNKADLVMIDMGRPNMQPENNIVKNLVYSAAKDDVKLTMVNGKILYRDGEFFLPYSPEEIYAKANAVINRMR